MQLGMIGLGRMGGNMAERLTRAGHDIRTYDPGVGSTAATLAELRDPLEPPRAFLDDGARGPRHGVDVRGAARLAAAGDAIVDGNSNVCERRTFPCR